MKRVIIAGTFLVLVVALVFAFSPTRSALADLAGFGDESCVTKVRSKDDLRDKEKDGVAELMKAGLTKEQAEGKLDPNFFAAEEVMSCPKR